jgi:hypothetical protein
VEKGLATKVRFYFDRYSFNADAHCTPLQKATFH